MTKYHYLPHETEFAPTEENCPLPLRFLMKQRITKISSGRLVRDTWTRSSPCKQLRHCPWTEYTRIKIRSPHRREARSLFAKNGNGMESIHMQEGKNPANLSERYMSLTDRLAFQEAKQKELSSFFENEVWIMEDENKAQEGRTLRAKFILAWKKNPDGSPRARARLICQGFRDPDALNKSLSTASPTLSRLSRGMILSRHPGVLSLHRRHHHRLPSSEEI